MSVRNIVTLSDVPVPLHDWYKREARRRSQEAGKRVGICTLVVEALEEYKAKHEPVPPSPEQREPAGVNHG